MNPPKTKSLFISYRSSDAVKVDKIAKDLSLLKHEDGTPRYTTWQDKHDLPPASPNWWDAIVDAIERCDMFVFNLSRASLQSEICRAELEYAHRRNRPIIPVVLDGEFFLDPKSGRYDLPKETWALVPDWLGESQFLFYAGTEFYGKFQEAVAVFERSWPRDIPAPRPLNPDSKSVHGSNHALYSAACDYAERLAFTDAEKHFDALVRRNDEDYADLAAQWLNLIRRYAELIEIVEHRSPAVVFNRKWTAYQALFPNDLVEDIFDPKGFAVREREAERERIVKRKSSTQLLPAPFAWIKIPGKGYSIAKYPVTNAQFAKFIEAGGYSTQRWWTAAGWRWREENRRTEPSYWMIREWDGAEQPVVGVSWYEAVAFCLWLSDATGEKIMLPTEDQWQYAAQGNDDRTYPWGDDWDCKRCNNSVNPCDSRVTTPVRHYEGKGDSPFGVVDMAGNVWEWCLTDYDNKTNNINNDAMIRVLRGGSWLNYNSVWFRCDFRYWYDPHYVSYYWGFRLFHS